MADPMKNDKKVNANIDEPTRQTVGQFLVSLRGEVGLTQKEVAERLHISNKTISRWETDRGLPDVELLGKVAALYGVTVDELLAGRRMTSQSEAEKAAALAAKMTSARQRFQRDSNIFMVLAILGLILYLWLNYRLNVSEMIQSIKGRALARGSYLVVWLSAVAIAGILIRRGLRIRLNELTFVDPQVRGGSTEMIRAGIRKLCAIIMVVAVGMLPFVLAREYRTYEKMMKIAEEEYLKSGQGPMDEEDVARMMEVFQMLGTLSNRTELIQMWRQLSAGGLLYVETYIQYLPMSVCIGLCLWEVGVLLLRLRDRKHGMAGPKKVEIGYAGVLLVGVALLLFITYYLGAYYGDEKYPDDVTYKDEKVFDAYVESYFNTCNALRENTSENMPKIWRGLTKIDPQYMDNAMPDSEAYDRYRGVSGFDYDTFTVYKNGNNMDWIDWMGRWNKVVFTAGALVGAVFLVISYARYRARYCEMSRMGVSVSL